MNTESENLKIAKRAYKEIRNVMERYEDIYDINFCWDECIWVGENFFQYTEMKGEMLEK